MAEALISFLAFFFLFLMSVVFHELGHAGAAYLCGDPTARDQGRITLNPIAHIDPIWSILMPILTTIVAHIPFGGAKPVPVNPLNFKHPRRDDLIVTLAGPAANLAQALIYAGLFLLLVGETDPNAIADNGFGVILIGMVYVNIMLAVFNLLPVPPLDGSHVLAALLPRDVAEAYRRIGFFGILILLLLLYQTDLGVYLFFATLKVLGVLGISPTVALAALKEIFGLAGRIGL
jgi:Zn-dependent protease